MVAGETLTIDFLLGAGIVAGTVTYEGESEGDVLIAAYENFPPGEGEGPLFFDLYEDVEFPLEYTINGILDGTYTLVAGFDVGGDNPTDPEGHRCLGEQPADLQR